MDKLQKLLIYRIKGEKKPLKVLLFNISLMNYLVIPLCILVFLLGYFIGKDNNPLTLEILLFWFFIIIAMITIIIFNRIVIKYLLDKYD